MTAIGPRAVTAIYDASGDDLAAAGGIGMTAAIHPLNFGLMSVSNAAGKRRTGRIGAA